MARASVLSPRARRDVLEAVRWIAKDNPAAALGLRDAVVAAARRIGEHPQIGVLRPELADEPVRFVMLTGYPYVIVYDSDREPPQILRVLHGARDLPEVLRDL
jgi:toxin ParE1/3/4